MCPNIPRILRAAVPCIMMTKPNNTLSAVARYICILQVFLLSRWSLQLYVYTKKSCYLRGDRL